MILSSAEWKGLRSSLALMQRDADQMLMRSQVLSQNMLTLTKIVNEIEYRDVTAQPESDLVRLSFDTESQKSADELIEKLKGKRCG